MNPFRVTRSTLSEVKPSPAPPHDLKGRAASLLVPVLLALVVAGCQTLAGERNTGVVIAQRAQIRSSTAIVAADLSEVLRGDEVEIIDSATVENGERWLLVRTRGAEANAATEGWIEARNVMPQELLERSRRLAEEDKDIPAQATGQLRAATNLRFSPDRGGNENILLKLESGSSFEIVGWKRVPKPKSTEATESDDAPKAGSAQPENSRRRGESEAAKATEEANETWYKVRLPPSTSPAPAGWVFGKQVELTVPSDIIFYRTGREFVAWQKLDDVESKAPGTEGRGEAREVQPGSWVILEKSTADSTGSLDEPDFDRIYVLGYDKTRREHYTAYRSRDLQGRLPLRVEGDGNIKSFTVRAVDGEEIKEYRFKANKDDRGHLRIEPQGELPASPKKK
jgi:hypothetical protein